MIVGIDVYHENKKHLSSVVGVVASMDKTFTEWYSVAGFQKSTHQEILKSIQNSFHKVLSQFQAVGLIFNIFKLNIMSNIFNNFSRKMDYYPKRLLFIEMVYRTEN